MKRKALNCSSTDATENTAVGIRRADTLYPQKLSFTSLTSGGRSV
jgi:hypothetical protein